MVQYGSSSSGGGGDVDRGLFKTRIDFLHMVSASHTQPIHVKKMSRITVT